MSIVAKKSRKAKRSLFRFAHSWNAGRMEQWKIGFVLQHIQKYHDRRDKPIMGRKKTNCGIKNAWFGKIPFKWHNYQNLDPNTSVMRF
jgi:hypothetical protein